MIYLGSDHGGFKLKEKLRTWLTELGQVFTDDGDLTLQLEDDYPDFAFKVAKDIRSEKDKGVLICRTGQGMAIAANRFPHVRAILGLNEQEIKKGREDEDANVLVLAADFLNEEEAKKLVEIFLKTPFSNEDRHKRRIEKITHVER